MTNRERNSSTDSSDRVGRCAMSTGSFLSGPTRYLTGPNMLRRRRMKLWATPGTSTVGVWGRGPQELLLRVVLDDELLLDRDVDLGPDRDGVHEDAHPRGQRLEP